MAYMTETLVKDCQGWNDALQCTLNAPSCSLTAAGHGWKALLF